MLHSEKTKGYFGVKNGECHRNKEESRKINTIISYTQMVGKHSMNFQFFNF